MRQTMRFLDLLLMSVNNLRRRKLRTTLTVLGVVIGTASIVVMVSLGIGLKELTMEQYEASGSLTAITVYSQNRWGNNDTSKEPNYITDDTVKLLKRVEHVQAVSPMLSFYVVMKQGVYEAQLGMNGVSREYMEQISIGEGSLPEPGGDLAMVVGNQAARNFYNTKSKGGYRNYDEIPDVDFLNKPMFVVFDTNAYYQAQSGGSREGGSPSKPPKKYMIPTAAMVEGGVDDWNSYSYDVYVDIDSLKAQLKRVFGKDPIPGQPTNKKGKPYNYFIYDQAIVYADDMSNVTTVQKEITDMGYQAYSSMEWLEQSQQQYNMIQAVLGGIGAVSLFVAAIGIANTMMMSIYERTKEIGIIKVLGCDMGVIRNMFLLESGFIGFMGGMIGIILSYTLSIVINKFLGAAQLMMGIDGDISRIPPWLSGSAILFAIFVGMAAGFFPALRAMKLSPLAAIRNE